jgi:pSer/pThr/pTyr-binding forkhead associated (FHA) protein
MSLLELGGKKFTIPVGEVALGSDAACAIPLTGAGVLPRHALFQGLPDGQVVIRKAAPAAEVLINGVRLGAEPTPLLHGDKVEVGGHELTFVDERRSGSTQFIQKLPMPEPSGQPPAARGAGKPGVAANTGGRVVSLTDGREYVITAATIVFGREAGCDIVVAGKDVSRRHAEIVQTPKGYVLVDSSTNGTFVNEDRVQGQRVLQRADVIRMGEESFRFYTDLVPAAAPGQQPGPAAEAPSAAPSQTGAPVRVPVASVPAAPPVAPPRAPAPVPAPVPGPPPSHPAAPPAGASERLKHTMHGVEAVPRPAQTGPPPLASLLVKNGALKNQRFPVRTPVFNIGRADYNDIVLPDPSVSTAHAKLQRREGVWVVVDLDSTNGTFVDGERVKGESPLAPGALLRFGDMQLVFEPSDDAPGIARGGGTQVMKDFSAVAPPPPRPGPSPPPSAAPSRVSPPAPPPRPRPPAKGRPASKRAAAQVPEQRGKGCRKSAAVLLLAAAAGLTALLYRLLA